MVVSSAPTSDAPAATRVDAVRKTVAGLGLVGFGLTGLVSAVLGTDEGTGTGPADLYAIAAEDGGPLVTSALVFLVSSVLMIPAVGGMLHLLRGRGSALGHVGAGFFVLGAFGHMGYATWQLMLAVVPHNPDRAAMVAFLDRSSLLTDVLLPLLLSVVVGAVLLIVALWRAGRLPTWLLGVTAAAVAFQVTAESLAWAGKIVPIVNWTAMAVVFGFIGVRVLAMSRSDWDRAGRE